MNKASVLDTRIYGHLLVATVEYSNANMHVNLNTWIFGHLLVATYEYVTMQVCCSWTSWISRQVLKPLLNSLHMQVWWIGLLRYWGTFLVATNEYGTACKYVEVGLHEYTGTFWWPLVKCTTGKMSVETRKPSRCNDASAGKSQDLVINSQK